MCRTNELTYVGKTMLKDSKTIKIDISKVFFYIFGEPFTYKSTGST